MCVKHNFIETTHSHVCLGCGLEQPFTRIDTWNPCSAPINKGYERTVRFRQKVDKLLFLQNAPRSDSLIWGYLKGCSLKTPGDVRKALRLFKGKNKHYDCIRLFTRCFTKFRVTAKHDALQLNRGLTNLFRLILRLWHRHNLNNVVRLPFLSYDFILRTLLVKLDSPLVTYCKPVTCKKRDARNKERLGVILAVGSGGMSYHMTATGRSHCVSPNASNRPCPRTSDASPPLGDAVVGVHARDSPERLV